MVFETRVIRTAAALALVFLSSSLVTTEAQQSDPLAGYQPLSDVSSQAVLDLDQDALVSVLGKAIDVDTVMSQARDVYQDGGHSKPMSKIFLQTELAAAIPEGTQMSATGIDGSFKVTGTAFETAEAGSKEVSFLYDDGSFCIFGGLPSVYHVKTGCVETLGGVLTVSGVDLTYLRAQERAAGRTLQMLSVNAEQEMTGEETFDKFVQYYGRHDYADSWIDSALAGEATNFNNRGHADFSIYGADGRAEAVKKGTAYMSVWMYAIHKMEEAIKSCRRGERGGEDGAYAWDEAFAYYTGSLEGQAVGGDADGQFPYRLAEKRCVQFGTCVSGSGKLGTSGISKVNTNILFEFKKGLTYLSNKQCDDLEIVKDEILKQMYIPLIQGTLRYAYVTDREDKGSEKAEAEGATFAAAILPIISACSETAATTIYDNMRVGFTLTDFIAVKAAFESQYGCMEITCSDVGGILDATGAHREDARPCSGARNMFILLAALIGFVVALFM